MLAIESFLQIHYLAVIFLLLFLVVILFFWRQLGMAKARAKIVLLESTLQDCEKDLHLTQQHLQQLQQEQQAQKGIQQLLQPFKEQLHQFQRRVNDVHTQSMMGQAALKEQVQLMMQTNLKMGEEAQQLAQALKGNKKILGNWGELQLETALEGAGLQKGVNYFTQQHFKNNQGERFIPDVVLALPEGKHLIVDSKVSLIAYQQAVAEVSLEKAQTHLKQMVKDIRCHIDDLSRKDYSSLPEIQSLGFVMMFMPIEAAYMEALQFDETLFQYAYSKGVVLVSQTTLLPTLRTIANIWMMADGRQQLQEMGDSALNIYNQLALVAEHLSKLGNALNSANRFYNQTVVSFSGQQGLINKLDKFKKLSTKNAKEMTELSQIDLYAETDRLEALQKRTPSSTE